MPDEAEAKRDEAFYRCARGLLDAMAQPPAEGDDLDTVYIPASDMECLIAHKLDALTELVEAIGTALVGDTYTTPHRHLARLLARRWGQCEVCLGACLVPSSGSNRQPCMACNGTGKAPEGEPQDKATICTDRDCRHCKYVTRYSASPTDLQCSRTGRRIDPWYVCMDFHRQEAPDA